MNTLSNLDLGSTILSIAVAAGFIACGLVILRLFTEAIKKLVSNFFIKGEKTTSARASKKDKGFL